MKQRQAVAAYGVLTRIGGKVTGKDAFALFRLKKELRDIVEFQAEEERKLVEKYGGEITGAGKIVVTENVTDFMKEYNELGSMDCDLEPVEIGEANLTMDEIEALDGFVIWRE